MGILPRGKTSDLTYTADGDMSALQYHIVTLSAAETVSAAGDNDPCFGVLKNAPDDGGQASIVTRGQALVAVDATTAILIGDYIESDGGVGVKIAATAASKRNVLGRALEALASGTGTIVVDIDPGVITNPAAA